MTRKYPIDYLTNYFNNLENKETYIKNSWLIVPKTLVILINDFLNFKNINGSDIEKKIYKNMTQDQFIFRLFAKRPLVFVGGSDSWTLRDNTQGFGNWETIGTNNEKSPLTLDEYLSYDEIEISSFLSISIYTPFINNGSRRNIGIPSGNCQPNGIYIGQCGARFERFNKMEWRYMIVDSKQNTKENGYGTNLSPYLAIWAKFYDVPYFPVYDEVINDSSGRYYKVGTESYLDLHIYHKRLKINAEIFLKEANLRNNNKKAYCYVVGLGLGAWKISYDIQLKITFEVYLELLNEENFPYVSDLYFGWFNKDIEIPQKIKNINIHIGFNNPADPLTDENNILVANWAWDPNSYIGNEYWSGILGTSGDPAAASCSCISYIGNPEFNYINKVRII